MNHISISSPRAQLLGRPLHFQATGFIADKLEPFNLGVLQWKRRDPRKFGLNEILLSAPAVQICELTVHVEISIIRYAVSAYVFTKKTVFKEQASSAATHLDILPDCYPRLIPSERHDALSRMTSAFTRLFRMEQNQNEWIVQLAKRFWCWGTSNRILSTCVGQTQTENRRHIYIYIFFFNSMV
jgi:hypothetical protein